MFRCFSLVIDANELSN